MKRRTRVVVLVGGLAVLAAATAVALPAALARVIDPYRYCETGFSNLIDCNYHWSSITTGPPNPVFAIPAKTADTASPDARDGLRPTVDVTAWAIAQCPGNEIAKRLLCAVPPKTAPVQATSDELVTGLPRPKPWLLTTAKNSPMMESIHLETPLGLAGVLQFYRSELTRRGWVEKDGTAADLDRALVMFSTSDGLALLRLSSQNDRTIVDLSRRKFVAHVAILPRPGQVRLLLGNAADEEVVITVNGQTTTLAAHAGARLIDDPKSGAKSQESQEIDLPPGKYQVTLKVANRAAQDREFEVAANETWGLLASPTGVAIPLHLY
jgi:hypothetical protein